MTKNSLQIKRLVGLAVLASIVIALQLISNNIKFPGGINITLALIPVVMGAILYGPVAGFILGAILGAIVITASDTLAYFMPVNPWATVLVCILKTAIAGFVAGWVFRGINSIKVKNNSSNIAKFSIAVVASALVTPIINTGLFIIFAGIFFQSVYGASGAGNGIALVFSAVMTTNFLIEFLVVALLSPALIYLVKILTRNYDLGFSVKFNENIEEVIKENSEENKELDIL